MFHNKAAIRQVLWVLLGETVCTALMVGVFALLNRFSLQVLLGAGIGLVLSVLNFLFLSIGVSRAADKAESGQGEQAAARARLAIQGGSVVRLVVLAGVYIVILSADVCDPLAAILPLLFVQPSLMVLEYFRRDGEKTK